MKIWLSWSLNMEFGTFPWRNTPKKLELSIRRKRTSMESAGGSRSILEETDWPETNTSQCSWKWPKGWQDKTSTNTKYNCLMTYILNWLSGESIVQHLKLDSAGATISSNPWTNSPPKNISEETHSLSELELGTGLIDPSQNSSKSTSTDFSFSWSKSRKRWRQRRSKRNQWVWSE